MTLPLQYTTPLRTYVKTALQEGLASVFEDHPDPYLRDTKVRLEYSFEEIDYPSVVVNFRPRNVETAGIGHVEHIIDPDTGVVSKITRRIYRGDAEFRIYALSTLDRDLLSDSLTQTLGMPRYASWTDHFWTRIYDPNEWARLNVAQETMGEGHLYNFLNLQTDNVQETGDTESPAPWRPEDVLLYETGQRVPVFGEVLTIPPTASWAVVQKVVPYPYIEGLEPVPTGVEDPAQWTYQRPV